MSVDQPPADPPATDQAEAALPGTQGRWQRLKQGAIAHWSWWAGGLGLGMLVALAATSLVERRAAPAPGSRAEMQALVRETILANPEIIPEAINRLQQREVEKLLASNRKAIETPFAGAWTGAKDADVVLVEFFDYNCPYCRKSSADVEKLLREDSRLKVVFRDFPVLGPESERFALASLSAAQQGRYGKFYASVFGGQGALSQERMIQSVRQAGLDESKVAQALDDKAMHAEVEKNLALGRALGLTGTPSYVIGNQILSGAVGYEALKKAVDEARAKRAA